MAECLSTPNFLWRIENFASIHTKLSPAIWIGGFRWKVRFCRFWNDNTEKILLILECENALESTLSGWQFRTEVSIAKSNNGDLFKSQAAKYSFEDKERWCIWNGTVPLIYSSVGDVNDVIFSIMISPIGDLEKLFKNRNCVEEVKPESLCMKSLIDDFRRIFNNEECSDFVLKCGEKSFYVHKTVLSARSKYFSGMFRNKTKKANESSAEIKDIEPDILEMVLRYMYTGDIPDLSMKSLQKVYIAADKFDVKALKIKCYSLFIEKFIFCIDRDSRNECEKDPSIKNREKEIMIEIDKIVEKKFLKDLFMSNEWRSFSQEFPNKAQEMCRPYLLPIMK